MEGEEFSVWCEENLSDDSLDKDDDEGDELWRGVGMLLTKFHIYSLFTTSHCAKQLRTIVSGKSVHFPFRIIWVLYTFLQ